MTSETLHEDADKLRPRTIDRHRAIVSLMEELEAVDWYDQRVDAATDEALAHNRDEEKEHAAMTLEWLRRGDPVFDQQLRAYLFSEGNIVREEEEATDTVGVPASGAGNAPGRGPSDGSLGIGSLRGAGVEVEP